MSRPDTFLMPYYQQCDVRVTCVLLCRPLRRRSAGVSACSASRSRQKASRTPVESSTICRRASRARPPATLASSPALSRPTRARSSSTCRQTEKSQPWCESPYIYDHVYSVSFFESCCCCLSSFGVTVPPPL